MSDTSGSADGGADDRQHVQFLAPIAGLLSVVFAVMAGASLSYALSQSTVALLVPAGLAAASIGSMYLKRRFEADDEGDVGDGEGQTG